MAKHELSAKQIKNLLCSAFEGGSNYWYTIIGHSFPEGIVLSDFSKGHRFQDPDDYWHPEEIIPTVPGCATLVTDGDHKFGVWLNLPALQNGFATLLEQLPRHADDIIAEDDDASTADCFLQMALFGEVLYG